MFVVLVSFCFVCWRRSAWMNLVVFVVKLRLCKNLCKREREKIFSLFVNCDTTKKMEGQEDDSWRKAMAPGVVLQGDNDTKWVLSSKLGEGGEGVVYEATGSNNIRAALKIVVILVNS